MTEETLFELAVRTPEAERSALLDRACEGKPELRQRVEALLKEDATPPKYVEQQPAAFEVTTGFEGTASFTSSDVAGEVIAGRYKLLEEIGEGGMGTVWMAQQSEPVKRLVAIKLIKLGMDSKAVLARFEAERQALAMMDHPNIAKVLDGGLTGEPGGATPRRPYFIMELVKGTPITRFCDDRKLTLRERLELFVPVCHAIQHAHQKGVIHRDIKPSNVLIAQYDDKPVPKVIDFGVAKATGAQLTEQTLNTGFGNIIGTPEYMSPEQASLNNLDIDTRSDVYALGVLLYELLTGTTPVDRKSLGQAALLEVLRIVREVEAPKPSTKLGSSEALPTIAANRHTEPAKLSNLMKGELDWIVMKALEKDRTRRYETANGFAADVLRYLCGEPVTAVPPSAGYRFKKFVNRNKGKVLATALLLTTLLLGVIGTTIGLFEAKRQEKSAIKAREAESERAEGERKAKLDAKAKQAEAEEERQIARAVQDFLQHRLLNQADTRTQAITLARVGGQTAVREAKTNPTIRELLDRAARELTVDKIDLSFPQQPLVQAEILYTVGNTYSNIGDSDKAIGFLQRSLILRRKHLGADHASTLKCIHSLALTLRQAKQFDQAQALLEETLNLAKKKYGSEHRETLHHMAYLALVYRSSGKIELALSMLEEALDLQKKNLGLDHRDTQISMNNLAMLYKDVGRLDQTLAILEEMLTHSKASLGPEHPDTLVSMNNLAYAYRDAGKLEQALLLFEESYFANMKYRKPRTVGTFLAEEYARSKAFADAEPLLRKTLASQEKDNPNDWSTSSARSRLGGALLGQKKFAAAEPLLLAGYEGMRNDYEKNPTAYAHGTDRNKRMNEAIIRLIWLYNETNKPDDVKKWQAEMDKLPKPVEKK